MLQHHYRHAQLSCSKQICLQVDNAHMPAVACPTVYLCAKYSNNLHSVDCDPCMTRLLKGVPQANNRKRSKCEGRMLHLCNAQCICNSCAASEQIQSPTATTLNGANYIQHLCDTCSAHTQSEPTPAVCPNASQHCMLVLHACTAFPGV